MPAISSIEPDLCVEFVKPTVVEAPALIVTTPADSASVIFVPPINCRFSVAPSVALADPSLLVSTFTVLNVFVSPVNEIQEPEPDVP